MESTGQATTERQVRLRHRDEPLSPGEAAAANRRTHDELQALADRANRRDR